MRLALLGILVGALLVPGAPAPAASPAPVAARAAVTPGSYLTVVDTGKRNKEFGGVDAKTQSLVLVAPTGEARTVFTRTVKHHRTFQLNDWSADGATALLVAQARDGADVIRVDVATGAATLQHVPLLNSAVLDPAGTGFLATSFKSERSSTLVLDAISWAGARTRLRTDVSGLLMAGHGGTVLTADGTHGRRQLLLSTTTGAVVNQFRGAGYCTAVRWWDATRVLESCQQGDLFLVDPATGVRSQLTDGHGRGDYGHLDARSIGSTLYVQVAGPCGYTYVARVTQHKTKALDIPAAEGGNVLMVDAVGDQLVLQHAASCDGVAPRAELTRYDPATGTESTLVRLGRKQAFGAVRVLGEVRASSY